MTNKDVEIGAVLTRLEETVAARRGASADASYTASLLAGGPQKCAKKFGEEAVEAALAAVSGDKTHISEEAADVLYHLIVMLNVSGITMDDVARVLVRREGVSGHQEKASRQ
ncbi:phosphoribosyl-ATP diphosphatase [Hyphococcus flavus]|uniref:Phosphoribosyl-ATP pyrophosphatase n=1 Tax=Hyphococcus flavus TaxID=1866326 RepID=A0AAF0CIF9_9PROT|nr:phosphoribosyl-ATP diphosphatase [Hyphococcus flavus]WDI32817.1 phosphoribosyl-ATP diphosphatase [Hyphococcus flavus]